QCIPRSDGGDGAHRPLKRRGPAQCDLSARIGCRLFHVFFCRRICQSRQGIVYESDNMVTEERPSIRYSRGKMPEPATETHTGVRARALMIGSLFVAATAVIVTQAELVVTSII